MNPELKKVIGIFGAWILMAIILWILIPEDSPFRLIVWAPIALIIIAPIITGAIIFLRWFGFCRPVIAIVNHKKIKSCMDCPVRFMKDNPVSPAFPICKCKDKGMRTCYTPQNVPRWCPHAIR